MSSTTERTSPGWSRLPIVASLLAGTALIAMAWSVSPVPDHDASYFMGTSISLAAGDGLVNRVDGLLWTRDPEGQARLITYPVVWPSVLSMLGGRSVRRTAIAVACVATISLILTALLLRPLAMRSPVGAGVAALAVASYASAFANGSMRPEALSSGLLVLLVMALPRLPESWRREALVGALVGVMSHVQVPLGVYGMLAWSGWASFVIPARGAVPRGAVVACAACGSFACGLYLHPYGGAEYLAALGHTMSVLPSEFSWAGWTSYWVTGVRFPALVGTMVLGVAAAVWQLGRSQRRPASPALLAATTVAFLAVFMKNTVPTPSRWYESIVILPLVYLAVGETASSQRLRSGARTAFSVLAALTLTANGLGVARRLAIWSSDMTSKPSFLAAQANAQREVLRWAPAGVIATTAQAWMLLPDIRRACVVPPVDGLALGTSCRVNPRILVLQQARQPSKLAAPAQVVTGGVPSTPGAASSLVRWRRVADHFDPAPNALLQALSPRASGWGFAIYVRED